MATKSKKKGGLRPKTYSGGLNKDRYERKGGGNRVQFKEGETVGIQFTAYPTDEDMFVEFDQHSWQEGKNKYQTVPCAGEEDCPLCDDDDDDISKTSYQFVTPVYNHKAKKYQMLRGGSDMAGKIAQRFKNLKKRDKAKRFLKTVYDITAMPGQFRTYDVDSSDEDPVTIDKTKLEDPHEWLYARMVDYYGDDMPGGSSMDDDDDEEDEKPRKKKKKSKSK